MAAAATTAALAFGQSRPLANVSCWNGLLGVEGEFRTVFDNTEYSTVRLPKTDELTYFFSDLTLYGVFHVAPGATVQLGGKAAYNFGDDAAGAPGPRAYLRLRGTYDGKYQHWLAGHFRDSVTPLTFEMRDYDDDLAGLWSRVTLGPTDSRLFLARTSTVGNNRYETFATGGRAAYTPWRVTTVGANLGGIHQGGFDAGTWSPPEGVRKREAFVGSLDLRQDIRWGLYAAGESAISVSRGDGIEGTARDSAFWAGVGWSRGPVELYGRFYNVGWAFETPWGERWLRNDEGAVILRDFYGWTAAAYLRWPLAEFITLTLGGEGGVKYKTAAFDGVDYYYNIELIKFEAAL